MSRPVDAYYVAAFEGQQGTAILDDLTQAVNGMADAHQAGATKLLLYILLKRSATRREKARGDIKPARLRKTDG